MLYDYENIYFNSARRGQASVIKLLMKCNNDYVLINNQWFSQWRAFGITQANHEGRIKIAKMEYVQMLLKMDIWT